MSLLRVVGPASGAAALAASASLFLSGTWHGSDPVVTNAGTAAAVQEVSGTGAIATEPNLRVAFIGDSGEGANFQAVLNLIKNEGADMVLHEGDFDYANDPDGFFAAITSVLGPTFPYLVSVGNHDAASWPEGCEDPDGCYATLLKQRMAATGITPDSPDLNDEMYATDFGGLSMVFVGQGANTGDCLAQANGYACYIRNRLKTDRHIWRICSWHKNQAAMQVGTKPDEMGWAVYNNCVDFGGIIASGHEHSYERTKTLTDAETQTVDLQQHPLASGIPSNPNSLRVKPGASFAFVSGLAGNSMRPQTRCLPATYPYGCNHEWGSIYTLNQTNNVSRYGVLFIDFYVDGDPYKAHAYFKTTDGQIIDSFDIHADFQDADADGIQDGIDNCPNWSNSTQALPPWSVPAGDPDCDGFTTTQENFVGTLALEACGTNAWPRDLTNDQTININDLSFFVGKIGSTSPGPPYPARLDFTQDGVININDLSYFVGMINESCTP